MVEAKNARPGLLLFIIFLIAAGVYGYTSILRVPVIEVNPASVDLGDVTKEGFNYTFNVKNSGKTPLEIERVSTSCGCTLATIDQETIMPDSSSNLLVTFNPKLMKEEVKGKVSRIIFIQSNDPENPNIEIKITANVVVA